MLLDAKNPGRVIARTAEPIFLPTADFERQGFVPNVVFPTGIVSRGGALQIFYGAADKCTGVVELSLTELMTQLHEAEASVSNGSGH